MSKPESREEFERMLAGQERHLRSATIDFAKGMSSKDKDAFLQIAIEAAWDHRRQFSPQPGYGLPQYWRRCLRYAATSREKWLIAVATLPGVFENRWVLGTRLGDR